MIDFDLNSPPVRKIGLKYGSLTGRLPSVDNHPIQFESALERDLARVLELRRYWGEIRTFRTQPLTITFYDEHKKERKYTPDMLVEYTPIYPHSKPTIELIEVKPLRLVVSKIEEFLPKWYAARAYCQERNWRFRVLTEKQIYTPLFDQARLLLRYVRRPMQDPQLEPVVTVLQRRGTISVREVLEAVSNDPQIQATLRTAIWTGLATGVFRTARTQPISLEMPLWLSDQEPLALEKV
jgi:hypothetical protein